MKNKVELKGLTQAEAQKRLAANGANTVTETPFNFTQAILTRLWEPSAWILESALIIELVLGKGIQAGFIILMLLFAAVNGAIQSRRANTVLSNLSHELTPTTAVDRDGKWQRQESQNLVVDDLISVRQGDIIPADVRLLTDTLEINESSISGESNAVIHQPGDTAYAGTEVLSGNALAVVTATGANSRSGKTISLIKQSSAPGHLQKLLGEIIGYLAIIDAVLAVILIIVAMLRHENLIEMLPFLAMLFIATIPIAMPSSFAVANSVEAKALGEKQVLVSDLTGIQEAANMNLLLVDKTGTITTNKPSVVAFYNFSDYPDAIVVQFAASAADVRNQSVIDAAILNYAQAQKIAPLVQQQFTPFDSNTGYSQVTVNTTTTTVRLGSLKKLMANTTNHPDLTAIDYAAGRSTAVAVGNQLIGLFILQDQPRTDSTQAIKAIQSRGVKVVMLTGDNQKTAAAVAGMVGLQGEVISYTDLTPDTRIAELAGIADVVPENKLAITKRMQNKGYVVGVMGDGINDAPALKQADVGIAVSSAVDLAKRSARMVMLADGLTPIIEILDAGHRVYQRMMTWTITKLSRTTELTLLLTTGYLILRFLPLTLNAMILVAILNDCVTLVLGTDRTTITYQPESWNLAKLSKIAGVFATSWSVIGYGWLIWLQHLGLTASQVSTGLYVYLIFSAMLTILMTRTKKPFWASVPSRAVIMAVGTNCLLTLVLAFKGLGIASISLNLIGLAFAITLSTGIMITMITNGFRHDTLNNKEIS